MKEEFRKYRETSYEISNKGKVRNRGKILKGFYRNKYHRVSLILDGKKKNVSVHRLVYETFVGDIPEEFDINHKNFSKTDNRVENLEAISRRDNMVHFVEKMKNRASKYIGVWFHKKSEKWRAKICINGTYKYLGDFNSEEDANIAYQRELKILDNQ